MKKGFTLVEVLVTLGILGVVAVLTLPNINKNYHKKVFVAQLQRTFNAIDNAMPTFIHESRARSLYDTDAFNYNRNPNNPSALVEFIKNNFKTVKICTANTSGGLAACCGTNYKRLSGGDGAPNFPGYWVDACTILKTGATVCFQRQHDKSYFPYVYIDVNGPKGPNVWGRDTFRMEFNNSGDFAESFPSESGGHYTQSAYCEDGQYGEGCFNKIVEDGWVMDY